MEFFKQNTRIDFMAARRWTAMLSVILFVFSIGSLMWKGLSWGLDFTGGTQIQLSFPQPANFSDIRQKLEHAGFEQVVVQSFGEPRNALVRVGVLPEAQQKSLTVKVESALPQATIQQVEFIGPVVGKALATNGILALVVSLIAIMIYVALRFEWRFAVSAVMALIHDPILILGVFSWFHIEFDLVALAAVLTVIGYSLNDTIVIYDRIRENFRRVRNATPEEVVNLSVNQTLSRTVMTSGLTLLAVLALFFFGGEILHGFSTALLIGIVIGTYSSIYIAGALAVKLGINKLDLLPPSPKELDDRP